MANYTIELRDVVSSYPIFAFPYPFYDERKRKEFEEKFIRHFYFREIGVPTVDRFIFNLQDKMNTVFPYYNELFKTAEIEYSVLDNYNVTETFERQSERVQKGAGFSSTVGQVIDSQNSETNDTRTGTNNLTSNSEGANSQKETTENTTNETGENSSTVNRIGGETGTDTKTNSGEASKTGTENKQNTEDRKFLDTPQGLLTLTGANYLTTLNQDVASGRVDTEESSSNSGTETLEVEHTTTGEEKSSGNHETDTTSNGERTLTGSDTQKQTSEESTVSEGKATSKFDSEQRTTQDNNTRTESKGEHSESYQLTRKGNIGVDTDADMIQKHINLQKVLTRIEQMFFDECEDLFMMVY